MERSYGDDSYSDYFECSPSVMSGESPETHGDSCDGQRLSSESVTPLRHLSQQPSTSYPASFYPTHYPRYTPPCGAPRGRRSTEQMLSSLLESQSNVVKMVENVSKRLGNLENVVANLSTKASDTTSSPDEKKRLPPQLSKTVAKIHDALDDDQQFRAHLGSKDEHNVKVKCRLAEEIALGKENVYSGLLIDRAIQRYFESRRRSWRETTDPTQQQRVTLQNKRRKVRARKQRLYERRSKFARSGEEKERFSTLTLDCMSEESSSDGGETILVHQPPWRSTTLIGYLKELDSRSLEAAENGKKKHVPQRKSRVPSSNLDAVRPPVNLPKWALSKDWLKDHPDCVTVTTPADPE